MSTPIPPSTPSSPGKMPVIHLGSPQRGPASTNLPRTPLRQIHTNIPHTPPGAPMKEKAPRRINGAHHIPLNLDMDGENQVPMQDENQIEHRVNRVIPWVNRRLDYNQNADRNLNQVFATLLEANLHASRIHTPLPSIWEDMEIDTLEGKWDIEQPASLAAPMAESNPVNGVSEQLDGLDLADTSSEESSEPPFTGIAPSLLIKRS